MDEVAFGRYRLLSVIGEGGMGTVYKAHDTVIGRDVAIKVLPNELGSEPGYRARFQREAYTAARLTEPHIIPIHDTGEIDGQLYLVMPVIDGIDLHGLLQRDGPMAPHQAVQVIEQLATALDAAHAAGLVHRDIKPSNALMAANNFVYLIDFGIAHDVKATRLTSTSMLIGTLAYMAPERFSTGVADPRSDIYALACVLHECLTGAQPYPGNSFEQQIAGHLTQAPPKPTHVNPTVPVGFNDVIATGMAKNPDDRYRNALELATAARLASTGTQAAGHPTRPTPAPVYRPPPPPVNLPPPPAAAAPQPEPTSPRASPKRAKFAYLAGGIALIVVIAIAAVLATSGPDKSPSSPSGGGLSFTGLNGPRGVAVDAAGNVYVSDNNNGRVVKLAAGSATQTVLPFADIKAPWGVAVDAAGNVYATAGNGVLKLAGGNTTTTLPFASPDNLKFMGVAVDNAGNVYATDSVRVFKLAAGTTTAITLPFTGLKRAEGVAVDSAGNVYVVDYLSNRVLKLTSGTTTSTLAFTGLREPKGVAVDVAGNVYVTDWYNDRVLKLAAGATTQTVLPFSGLSNPSGVAVDGASNVYVTDYGHNRVLKWPP